MKKRKIKKNFKLFADTVQTKTKDLLQAIYCTDTFIEERTK